MELLVSVIIATFIVGVCFMVLNLVSKNIFQIQNNYDQGMQFNMFKEQLAIDMHRFPDMKYSEFEKKLLFTSPIDSIVYYFDDAFLVRNTDTLTISLQETSFYFLGNKTKQGAVDALKLVSKKSPNENSFFLTKETDVRTRITNGN
jgi:hypothetical protein